MIDFFFDIDGTILPFGCPVPESAVRAIRHLREIGNRAFLATGRSAVEVSPSVLGIGFDGGVFSAGADVVADGKHIYTLAMNESEKKELFSYCRKEGFYLLVQTPAGTYVSQEALDFWRSAMHRYTGTEVQLSALLVSDSIPQDASVTKLLYVTEHTPLEKVRADLSSHFDVVNNTVGLPSDMMGEIVIKGISKATGIDKIVAHYGNSLEYTVAFGDGANDIEMVEHAGIGIAMGNASSDLKAVADWIAPDVSKDGLAAGIDYVLGCFSGRL